MNVKVGTSVSHLWYLHEYYKTYGSYAQSHFRTK